MVSFIRALMDFFASEPYGKKVTATEFKELTVQDKFDLCNMLTVAGIEHEPFAPSTK